jgi:hypothetical protein
MRRFGARGERSGRIDGQHIQRALAFVELTAHGQKTLQGGPDAQSQAIQPRADLGPRLCVITGEPKIRQRCLRALNEQDYRFAAREAFRRRHCGQIGQFEWLDVKLVTPQRYAAERDC